MASKDLKSKTQEHQEMKNASPQVSHKLFELVLIAILFIGFTIGIIGYSIPQFASSIVFTTQPFLLISNLIVTIGIFSALRSQNKQSIQTMIFWMVISFTITIILEIVGVETGLIFGEYEYGETLSWKILGVPWVIGWNWVLVTLGFAILIRRIYTQILVAAIIPLIPFKSVQKIVVNPWFWLVQHLIMSILTGLAAVGFDYLLEPVAIQNDYWTWAGGDIPLQNYAAWFCISFALTMFLHRLQISFYSHVAEIYVLFQMIFFLFIVQ